MSSNKLQIIKWNIYTAKVPFTSDFSKNKNRPVIVLALVGGDVIVLPISSKINKKTKYDIDISLDQKSLIKVANIQSISQSDIISPFYSFKNKKILKIENKTKAEIKTILKIIFSI